MPTRPSWAASTTEPGTQKGGAPSAPPRLMALWLEHLSSYEKFPPLQPAESYNLSQVLEQVKQGRHGSD